MVVKFIGVMEGIIIAGIKILGVSYHGEDNGGDYEQAGEALENPSIVDEPHRLS